MILSNSESVSTAGGKARRRARLSCGFEEDCAIRQVSQLARDDQDWFAHGPRARQVVVRCIDAARLQMVLNEQKQR
jgi:hypothetical protein